MRSLFVDFRFDYTHHGIEEAYFHSETSWLDFDVVFWNMKNCRAPYPVEANGYKGEPLVAEYSSSRLMSDIARREREVLELLRSGRTVFALLSADTHTWVYSGDRSTSGTGRNQKVTNLLKPVTLSSCLGFYTQAIRAAAGVRTELATDNSAVRAYWSQVKSFSSYEALVEQDIEDWFKVRGTETTVGGIAHEERGNIVLLPMLHYDTVERPDDDGEGGDNDGAFDEETRVVTALTELAVRLAPPTDREPLPSWAEQLRLPAEQPLIDDLNKLEQQHSKVIEKLEVQRLKLESAREWKQLLTATGDTLQGIVVRALRELGFSVVDEPVPGRTDIVLATGKRTAVVEVKGKSKSAAEGDAAQLEKWTSSYFTDHGTQPKGVLLVNAYRTKPLAERAPAFPQQMLGYSKARGHCLLTSSGLLALLLAVRAKDLTKQRAQATILDAVGIAEVPDLAVYLSEPILGETVAQNGN